MSLGNRQIHILFVFICILYVEMANEDYVINLRPQAHFFVIIQHRSFIFIQIISNLPLGRDAVGDKMDHRRDLLWPVLHFQFTSLVSAAVREGTFHSV